MKSGSSRSIESTNRRENTSTLYKIQDVSDAGTTEGKRMEINYHRYLENTYVLMRMLWKFGINSDAIYSWDNIPMASVRLYEYVDEWGEYYDR